MQSYMHIHLAAMSPKAMREQQQVTAKVQAQIHHAMDQAIANAVRLYAPYVIGIFALTLIGAVIKGRMQRWERDHENRRMAKAIWDAKPRSSPQTLYEVRCADCGSPSQVSSKPDPSMPFYCERCYRRRLDR